MLIGNDLFNQSRRRFKHNNQNTADRQAISNKQRVYKRILDEQIQEKHKVQHMRKLRMASERVQYERPADSQRPNGLFPNTTKHSKTNLEPEIRNGFSRFITDPKEIDISLHHDEEDSEVNNYLEECEKILNYMRDLAKGKATEILTHKKSNRKFIRLNKSRNLLSSSNMEDIEERYNREYNHKFPQISPANREVYNRQQNAAIIVNPILITQSNNRLEPLSDNGRSFRKSVEKSQSPKASPIKRSNASRVSKINSPNLSSDNLNPQVTDAKNSKLSQLQMNTERLKSFVKIRNPTESEQPSLFHRQKANGYKLLKKSQTKIKHQELQQPEQNSQQT